MQTDMDTDVESTQSRQKKGQMKSIFLSDSDEEAIVEYVKQHEELFDQSNDSFKDKQKKERLWEQLAATRNLPVKTVKKWFDTQHTRYGKLTQMNSGQAAHKSTESQTWLKDSFSFLRGHIRRNFQVFCIQVIPEAFCSHSLSFSSGYTQRQNLRWKSVLHQMLLISLQAPVLSDNSLQSQLQDQFQQMRSMISSFPGERQDPLQVHDSRSATISTMLSSFSVKYSTRPKNARDRSPQVNRPPHFNFHKQHRPQEDVNTYSPFQKLSFHSSCTANTDFHWRTCYSDCKSSSTATTKAFIFTVYTACYVLRSCG